jgi:hypothetical protein
VGPMRLTPHEILLYNYSLSDISKEYSTGECVSTITRVKVVSWKKKDSTILKIY